MLCLCCAVPWLSHAVALPCYAFAKLRFALALPSDSMPLRRLSAQCPCISVQIYAFAHLCHAISMLSQCPSVQCPSSSLQCLRLALRCYALPLLSYAVLIQCPSVQCLSLAMMRNATLCPCSSVLRLCVAKLCHCISNHRPSSQCLRRSRPRLTKQCPRFTWPSYAGAPLRHAKQCPSCSMPSRCTAYQCLSLLCRCGSARRSRACPSGRPDLPAHP